jgi:hypothetical protein
MASVSVILSVGRKLSLGAIYHSLSAASIYLHDQSLATSSNSQLHSSGTFFPDSFITTLITSFLSMLSSNLYSSGLAVLSAIKPLAARKLAASSGDLIVYSSQANAEEIRRDNKQNELRTFFITDN